MYEVSFCTAAASLERLPSLFPSVKQPLQSHFQALSFLQAATLSHFQPLSFLQAVVLSHSLLFVQESLPSKQTLEHQFWHHELFDVSDLPNIKHSENAWSFSAHC